MRSLFLAVLCFLSLTAVTCAETITLDFGFAGDLDSIDGFIVWERTQGGMVAKVENIAPAATQSVSFQDTLPADGSCKTYFVTTEKDFVYGNPSNVAGWCPEINLPDMVARPGDVINLRITVEESPAP
jgi:hypothetical protein